MSKPLQISQEQRALQLPQPSYFSNFESEFTKEYLSAFGLSSITQFFELAAQQMSKMQRSIKYDPKSDFKARIQVRIVRYTDNYELIDVEVKLGYFFFPSICIINISSLSLIEEAPSVGAGAYGKVYKCHYKGRKIAIKCFKKSDDKLTLKHFSSVLTEYCMLKIASALEAGPSMTDIYGFDIMVFEDCIEFGMELCEDIEQYGSQSIDQMEKNLKESLLKLHFFGVIHHDIKNYNIAFSNEFSRFVFLDFGLSKVIKQDLSHKSFTTFRGTTNFCSEQMDRIKLKTTPSFVDLYYNDLFGLRATVSLMRQKNIQVFSLQKLERVNTWNQQASDISDYLFTYFLKYMIFQKQNQKVLQIIDQQQIPLQKRVITQLASFMTFVRYNVGLQSLKLRINEQLKRIDRFEDFFEVRFEHIDDFPRRQNILEMVNCLRSIDSSQYYISELAKGRKRETFELLTDKAKRVSLKRTEYLLLLSKAVQFNFTPFDLEEATAICESALSELGRTYNYQPENKDMSMGNIWIALVSELLFHLSLKQKLKGEYFEIFINVLANVMVCSIFLTETLLRYHSQILYLNLPFAQLLKYLLYFNANKMWIDHESPDKQITYELNISLKKINSNFLSNISHSKMHDNHQIGIFINIFDRSKYISLDEINQTYRNCDMQTKRLFKIHNLQKYLIYEKNNLQDSYSSLRQCQAQNNFNNSCNFEHYHFELFFFSLEKKKFVILNKLLSKYQKVNVIRKTPLFYNYLKYICQIMQWQITNKNLKQKLQQISKHPLVEKQIPCFQIFRLLSIFFKQKFNKIQQVLQKYQILQLFNMFENILKRLCSFRGGTFLLNMQIIEQKINFHAFVDRKRIGKKRQLFLLRSLYKEDYFSLKECSSEQNQVFHTFDFYIRRLYILFKILVVIGERKASFGLQQRLINALSKDKQFLLRIIWKLFCFLSPNCQSVEGQPQLCRLILTYDQIIQEKSLQIIYFQKQILLIDLLTIYHIKRPDRCFYILKKMFKLLNIYNTAKNIKSLTLSIKLLIRKNVTNIQTRIFLNNYIQMIDLQNTPYEFSIIYTCFVDLAIGQIKPIYRQFINIVPSVKFTYSAEFIGALAMIYLIKSSEPLPDRKVRRLNYSIVRYRFFPINLSNVMNLLINPSSLKSLKINQNFKKLNCYSLKLKKLLQYIFQIPFHQGMSASFAWNKIYPKKH